MKKINLSTKGKIVLITILTVTPISFIILSYYFWFTPSEFLYFPIQSKNYSKNEYFIEMSDGVRLATDVYLPLGKDTCSAILFRTPYGKYKYEYLAEITSLGVALLIQDHRGCPRSEGNYTGFAKDGQDALDTVNWMKNQSWFNGTYATTGGSAMGITQYMQVPFLDDVAFQDIAFATPYLYDQAFFQGGAPRKMLAEGWLERNGHGDYYFFIFENPLSNTTFAIEHRINDYEWGNVTWPSIHIGGWYDCFQQGIIDGFMGYQYKGGFGGANNAKLIIGPWTHDYFPNQVGELTYPDNASDSHWYYQIREAMFNERILNNTGYDYRVMPNITYYIMGDVTQTSDYWNRWAKAEVWPVPYTNQTYYLQYDQTLNTTIPISAKNFSYIYDPRNNLTTLGGCNLIDPRGPYDQRSVEDGRTDVLHFDFDIITPLLVVGRIWGHLFIKSNCTDTDFIVKLIDVYPDGRNMLVNDGIIRMRYRDGQQESKLMDDSENTIYEAFVDLWSTAYVFNASHKLRISISSSNYPRFDVNPNTGDSLWPVNGSTITYNANNTIVVSPTNPSSIILPIPINIPDYI